MASTSNTNSNNTSLKENIRAALQFFSLKIEIREADILFQRSIVTVSVTCITSTTEKCENSMLTTLTIN